MSLKYIYLSIYASFFTDSWPISGILFLQCARQGFALGLTVLVGAIPCIKIDALLKLTVDLLEVSSSMKGQVGRTPLSLK